MVNIQSAGTQYEIYSEGYRRMKLKRIILIVMAIPIALVALLFIMGIKSCNEPTVCDPVHDNNQICDPVHEPQNPK